MLTLTINTDNDAFGPDDDGRRAELARILRVAAVDIERGGIVRSLHDVNGNKCGSYTLSDG